MFLFSSLVRRFRSGTQRRFVALQKPSSDPRPSGHAASVASAHRLTACENLSVDVRAGRQAHRKHRALAWLARHRHIAAHHARELAGDGKAEPGAAELLRSRGIGLAELLEQLSLLLRSHAYTGVGDGQLNPVATVGDT